MSSKTTKVGAAWSKTANGKTFISVVINNPVGQDFNYVLWPVENKRADNSPDYDVTKQSDAARREQLTAALTKTKPTASEYPEDDGNVPF